MLKSGVLYKMINIVDKSNCCGCGACVESCPQKCIILKPDTEGILYPEIDTSKCIHCNICESVCSFSSKIEIEYNPIVVAAKALDDKLRNNSSSGGAFSVFAEHFLAIGGLVCGVSMTDDCEAVQHIIIDSIDALYKLRGSKYIPSKANVIFPDIKHYLDEGRPVLFSGVSCQVAALNKYLRKKYSNLLTVEIICHGVPSPELWVRYKRFWEKKHHKIIDQVFFRNKKYGWANYGNCILTRNSQRVYFQFSAENPYFIMFNSGKALRPSCYNCAVKNGKCQSDISLGDFWGINNYTNAFEDDKGVSLICINTDAGKNIFELISNKLFYISDGLDYEKAAISNPGVNRSVKKSIERENFYLDLYELSFEEFLKKYAPIPKKQRIKGVLLKTHIWQLLKGR